MTNNKYHKYVFDESKKQFIGDFEKMYVSEDIEGFDSWHENDTRVLRKKIALEILNQYQFPSVLEIGCGKGVFTQQLKKKNNYVLSIDKSKTAIEKSKRSFPDIEFRCLEALDIETINKKFDCCVIMTVLVYIDNWPLLLEKVSRMSKRILVAEYIPKNSMGFIKSAKELQAEFEKNYSISNKVIMDDEHIMLLGESKNFV
jgi:2-polyprenyl-3-methyl-5-hydroxy-6-metoxy-1,4-benzoquinol methylase